MRRGFQFVSVAVFAVLVAGCGLFKKKEPVATADQFYPTEQAGYASTGATPTQETGYSTHPVGARSHTVAKKETLFSIARTYYNDQSKWRTIYDANRQQIGDDPNRIRVGQQLVIP